MSLLQKHPSITRRRVQNFLKSEQWKQVNILNHLYLAQTSDSSDHIRMECWSTPDQTRPTFQEAVGQEFRPIEVGHCFAPSWTTHWVRVQLKIPTEMDGQQVRLLFDSSSEAMVWSTEGVPLQGLTGGHGIDRHVDYVLTDKAVGGSEHSLYVEVACNGMFGNGNGCVGVPDPNRSFPLSTAQLVVYNREVWSLYHDLQVIIDIATKLPEDSPRAWQSLRAANDIVNHFPSSIDKCREIAKRFLGAKSGDATHQVYAVGNCHIDTAWLWPYSETRRKVARSFSTQLRLMDQYPQYRFAASQAQQFEWLQEDYPELFKQVQAKAQVGQFIPLGATWIEMDCNVPTGESLVRQFLLGQQYFQQMFGQMSDVFWLPDTFGYSSQLPQIAKQAGCRYFFTQKLSWNNINRFPHTTFRWTGLDGSQVLTHMAPADTYTGQATAAELIQSVTGHKDLAYTNESLYLYGNGDGGGGPLGSMLERLQRMENVDGLPKVKHSTPSEFFQHVEKTVLEDLVEWKGELYLELHRGTYTSQANNKKYNRQCEMLLRDCEILAVIASVNSSFEYPYEMLTRMWKQVCLNQFHDVLPGTSIEVVFRDTDKMYQEIVKQATALKQNALVALFGQSKGGDLKDTVLVNTTGWPRTEVVAVQYTDSQQICKRDNTGLMVASVDSYGSTSQSANVRNAVVPVTVTRDSQGNVVLKNQYISATICGNTGQLISLQDLRPGGRSELISSGYAGNVFNLHDDVPLFWDAWDIEIYSQEKYQQLTENCQVEIVDQGPLLGSVSVSLSISSDSHLRQWISLTATSARLDFDTDVDWHETHKCLKVSFCWSLINDMATYETQFGIVQRPTHQNTSWDMAKFEVCGHKFADLSEHKYGVALINDSKYGYSTLGNTMSLSLLRSPKGPDPNCDMGHHTFRYAVYPHLGSFNESDVVREAYQFNAPLVRLPVDVAGSFEPIFQLDPPNVVLDTVKLAEDKSGDVVVRVYEAMGGHTSVQLTTSLSTKSAYRTNILETECLQSVDISSDGQVKFDLGPFEVATIRFIRS